MALNLPLLPYQVRQQQLQSGMLDQEMQPTPEEESGLLGKAAGGLQYIAETLDKPGAAVRGVLGGQGVNALANLIPFSDTLGLTDPEKRIYGSDLLEQWGVLSPKQKQGFDWTSPDDWGRAMAGFAVDVVTDPLTMVGGPLSKGIAKGAQVASHTPITLSAAMRTGEAPLATLHAPFWAKMFGASGKPIAELSAKNAPRLAEAAAKANTFLAYKTPVKHLRGLLSPAATGFGTNSGSRSVVWDSAQQMLNDLNYSMQKTFLGDIAELSLASKDAKDSLLKTFTDIAEHHGKTGDSNAEQLFKEYWREAAENRLGVPDADALAQKAREILSIPETGVPDAIEKTAALGDQLHRITVGLQKNYEVVRNRVESLGLSIGKLSDPYVTYGPRYSVDAAAQKALNRYLNRTAGLPEDTVRPYIARREDLRAVPGGTNMVDKGARDPLIAGFTVGDDTVRSPLSPIEMAEDLRASLKEAGVQIPVDSDLRTLRALRYQEMIGPELEASWTEAQRIAPQLGKDGLPLAEEIAAGRARAVGKEKFTTYEKERVKWLGTPENPVRESTLNLLDAIDDMSPETIRSHLRKQMSGASGITKKILEDELASVGNGIWEHGVYGRHVIDDAVAYQKFMAETESMMLSAHRFLAEPGVVARASEHADWATLRSTWTTSKLHGISFNEDGLRTFVRNNAGVFKVGDDVLADTEKLDKFIDTLHVSPTAEGALRTYQQLASPKVQNALLDTSDFLTNIYKGGLYAMWPASYIRNLASDIWQHSSTGRAPLFASSKKGGGILGRVKDAYRYIRDGGKTKDSKWFDEYVHLVHSCEAGETRLSDALGPVLGKNFGGKPEGGLAWVLKGTASEKESAKDFAQRILGAGARAQQETEFVSRAGYYAALRDQGYSASQAVHMVKQSGFDYGELSKFEQNVMKRLVPFWMFSARNIPWQLAKLANDPGGITAQTARALSQAASRSNRDVYTPSFLQETQAVPIGETNTESQSFFKNSMIPLNDFNDLVFRDGLPNVPRSIMKSVARMHPAAIALPEMFADRQFYTGRKISDLDSPTESMLGTAFPLVDRALHYSPASRFIGELRSTVDPRKTVAQKASNLLGTGGVSTYNVADWKLRDLRDAYGKILERDPRVKEWKDYFIPKSDQEKMDPGELAGKKAIFKRLAQLTKTLGKRRKNRQAATAE